MRHSTKRNRGVVLLIVLSLLVLFTIMAVTFVVVSASYRDGAVASSRYRRVGDDPRRLLDASMYALVRGTRDENSSFRGHELLRDFYGSESFTAKVNTATFRSGNQLIDVTLKNVSLTLSGDSGFYNGQVITFVSGEAGGVSTRIVAYDGPTKTFRIVAPYIDGATKATLAVNDGVVVNGKAFSGTGAGYNSANETTSGAALLDTTVSIGSTPTIDIPVVFLPNLPGHTYDSEYTDGNLGGGDLDECYDAADYQNIPLAAVIPTTADPNIPNILPSFHRAAMINYVFKNQVTTYLTNQGVTNSTTQLAVFLQPYGPDNVLDSAGGSSDDHIANTTIKNNIVALKRAMIFRPLPELNPNFDGGNSAFTPSSLANSITSGTNPYVIGGWDVDNDGDGYADGIWINPGFPLQTTEDGRLARPLVSVLAVDMDGKINLNANGNWAHIVGVSGVTSSGPHPQRTLVPKSDLARTPASDNRPQGQGYGPGEIDPTVGTTASASDRLFEPSELEKLLLGISSRPGRYAANQVPGAAGLDTLASRKFYDIAADFTDNTTTNIRGFQTVPDLRGELAVGLNHAGQPRWDQPKSSGSDVRADGPYDLNLATNGPVGVNAAGSADTPFSPAELERILRINDVDAGLLPDRLAQLFSVFTTDSDAARNRRLVTTDSYDVPIPHLYYPSPWLAPATTSRPASLTDLASRRVRYYIDNDATLGSLSAAQRTALVNRVMAASSFFSPDLLLGAKMDINRPFGDSRDNNGNGVVDEHWPAGSNNEATGNNEQIDGAYVDHDNDGLTNEDGSLARHYFARHLYQLMMLLAPVNGIDIDGDGTATRAETAPVLAQWVANVVDFRDPDAIMTPFEYDSHPFSPPQKGPDGGWGVAGMDDDGDGTTDNESEALWAGSDDIGPWSVDGYLGAGFWGASDDAGPERALVWGCERPELLITETLAFHDRRVEDLATPEELTTRTDGMGNVIGETDFEAGTGSNDFDQALRPRGYLYVEINNPQVSIDERKPLEFYDSNTQSGGVVLSGTAGTSPIWRLAVTRASDGAGQASLSVIPPATTAANLERVVYFTTATSASPGATETPAGTLRFNAAVAPARVMPGRYAVVGTYHETINENDPVDGTAGSSEYVALIGRRNDIATITDKSITRRIIMHADAVPDKNWFYVANSNANSTFNGNAAPSWLPETGVTPTNSNYIADMLPAVTIPVNGLNVSEGTYPANDPNGDAYGTTTHTDTGEPIYTLAYDRPFDLDPTRSIDRDPSTAVVDTLATDKTYNSFRRIHLQRLANPLEAYSATTNPYITIDSLVVDLTVFNGMASGSGPGTSDDPDFTSRERGSLTSPVATTAPDRRLWTDASTGPQSTTSGAIANHHFSEQLKHSLGGLNQTFKSRFQKDLSAMPTQTTTPSDEFIGAPNSNVFNATNGLGGAPFPWLTWNNRPYVSELELMLVPKFPAWQVLQKFALTPSDDPYAVTSTSGTTGNHYPHLLNFFDSRTTSEGAHFYRVLEYLGVPSRFIGSETWLNKTTFASGVGTDNFHPPFNRIPAFREPGQLNVNTIYDDRTWRALTRLTSTTDFATPNENPWSDSRRGYGTAGSGIISIDDSYPTIFANPLRSSGSGRLVPIGPSGSTPNMVRADVDCTLLRSNVITPSGTAASGQPNFATTSGGTHIEPDRNPYFRYQSLQRLSNLVTCRSNVYAVWITIGVFEVDPVTGGLGQEIGSETGEVQRHRAFYMIDRSIPVAYEPGENHNVDRAILVRRFIE
ncbi:MAG: hypothetical protein H6822_27410 [Planctomycetaceae bacterium]|nr:hypothetical protein [Planctomycetales bacterium]MCB9925908.1 hypothetical protein [Planctomycetaceae bacterium]